MEVKTLYIIGNGFDLHHGLPTQYRHFKAYVQSNDHDVYDWMEDYVPAGNEWADLEAALAHLDTDNIVNDLEHFMGSYSDENWSEAGHHAFQYEVNRVAEGISETLQALFSEWVRTIQIPDAATVSCRLAKLDPNATYLTFNYTSTLSKIYDVPTKHILHIHGEAVDSDSELIIGHGWSPDERTSLFNAVDNEDSDHRVMEAMSTLDDYFSKTFKPSHQIIDRNVAFFDGIGAIERIVVLGHSLADVDAPYFQAVVKALQGRKVSWTVAVRKRDEERGKMDRLNAFGVHDEQIECKLWSEF